MSLASPDRLLWLLVAVPIVLMYILKTRLRRRSVSTLLFWEQIFDERRQRAWWQNLRHWLSLALQLLVVGLLGFALADPNLGMGEKQAYETILVLDNSASMSAVNADGQSRLDLAIAEAQSWIDGFRPGDRAAILTAGGEVRVLCGMTDFAPTLRDALEQVAATDTPTSVADAIVAARRLSDDAQRRRIVVISDGALPKEDGALPKEDGALPKEDGALPKEDGALPKETAGAETVEAGVATANRSPGNIAGTEMAGMETAAIDGPDIRWVIVGEKQDNVGITAFQARRSTTDPVGYASLVEIENFGEEAAEGRLQIRLDEDLVDVIPLTLEPGQPWRKTIQSTSAAGGVLTAQWNLEDAYADDNVARAVIAPRPPIPVQLQAGPDVEAFYLRSVFRSIPRARWIDETEETGLEPLEDLSAALRVCYLQNPPDLASLMPMLVVAPEGDGPLLPIATAGGSGDPGDSDTGDSDAGDGAASDGTTKESDDTGGDRDASGRDVSGRVAAKRQPAWSVGPPLPSPIIAKQDPDSPILRHTRMQNVLIDGARAIEVHPDLGPSTTLLETADGSAVMVAVDRPGGGRLLLLSADLDSSDLPLRIAFPVMMTNAMNWFLRQSGELDPALETGIGGIVDVQKFTRDNQDAELLRINPDGSRQPLRIDDGKVRLLSPSESGLYAIVPAKALQEWETQADDAALRQSRQSAAPEELRQADLPLQLIAVNVCNRHESDLRPGDWTVREELDGGGGNGRPLWILLTLGGIGVVLGEWFLFNRRWVA
ncbi:MAG: BatA and WFA domain-containing protein [Planctomycetota bacterium]